METNPNHKLDLGLHQVELKKLASSYNSLLAETVSTNQLAQVVSETPSPILNSNGYSPAEIIIAISVLLTAVGGLVKVLVPVMTNQE